MRLKYLIPVGLFGLLVAASLVHPAAGAEGTPDGSAVAAADSIGPCLRPAANGYFRKILPLEEFHPGQYTEFSLSDAEIVLDKVVLVRKSSPAIRIELVHPGSGASDLPTFSTKNFVGILKSGGSEPGAIEAFGKIAQFIKARDDKAVWSYCSEREPEKAGSGGTGMFFFLIGGSVLFVSIGAIWLFMKKRKRAKVNSPREPAGNRQP